MADLYFQQSLSQQQTLAPQMRKSLEILQAGTMELSQLITQALEANPTLEDVTESVSLDEEGPDAEEADSLDYLNETDDDWRDRSIMEGKSSPWTQEDEERRQRLYDSIVAPVTLQQHLQQQLDLSMVEPAVRAAAQAIIGNLDERGFLDLPVKELGQRLGIKPAHLNAGLRLIQSFDPAGVGASGIAESLLLQLERASGTETIEYRIVRDHLEDLARKRQPQIAKALGTSLERVAEAASRIGRLTPNPGGDFNPTGNPYIVPDVVIEWNDDGLLEARLTGEKSAEPADQRLLQGHDRPQRRGCQGAAVPARADPRRPQPDTLDLTAAGNDSRHRAQAHRAPADVFPQGAAPSASADDERDRRRTRHARHHRLAGGGRQVCAHTAGA